MDFKVILEKTVDFVLSYGIRLLIAAVLLIAGSKLISWLMKKMKRSRLLGHAEGSVRSFMLSFTNVALKTVLIVTVAAYLGVPMTSIIALVGSAGVAIGLAMQGGLANIAGGLMILIFRPFGTDDFISVGEYSGTVHAVGIFHTVLITPDQRRVVMPNSIITGETLINYSTEPLRRLDLDFGASYDDDPDRVKAVLLATAADMPEILNDPAAEAMIQQHDDSAVIYRLRIWCKREDYWKVYYAMQERVLKAFQREGVSIPYPQLDVHTK